MSYELIDTHCHLDFPEFDCDRKAVLERANTKGINHIINIGSSLNGSKRAVELSEEYDCVYATVGIHPHEADNFDREKEKAIKELAGSKKVVAIGEIGLDYYRNYSKAENQKPLFKCLVSLAKEYNLPVVIHNRLAEEDTLRILKDAMPIRAVVHCFSGDENFLNQCLELGFFVSFTCNITYKKASNLRNLVNIAPIERIFLETDAPFLPPEGMRGQRNEPSYVKELAEEIARIKNKNFEEIANITTNNAKGFFNLR